MLCPEEALKWDNRKLHVIEEMLTYSPTILCLEEVDHFNYIHENLTTAGYQGIFFPKPDSPCLYSPNNSGPDGCAVFWKPDHLHLQSKEEIVLQSRNGMETNQVAIICTFTHIARKKDFCLSVTHLKSKTPYWQLRHEQGEYLEKVLCKTVEKLPIVVCGDFNAEPSEQVYEVFKRSRLQLASAYCHLSQLMEEPKYTTWKVRGGVAGNKEVAHCIDYIWYSSSHWQPVAILKLPTEGEIGKDRLPSYSYPSDHLSLVVDFVWKA